MFYDPDAPKFPGQPDYSKGCIVDLPDELRDQPPRLALPADVPPPAAGAPASSSAPSAASTATPASTASTASADESDLSSHSAHRTVLHGAAALLAPSPAGADDMAAFDPPPLALSAASAPFQPSAHLASLPPPGHPSLLTALSPYLSVLYALLAAVMLLSFYFIPLSRARVRQKPPSAEQQAGIGRVLQAARQQAEAQRQRRQQQEAEEAPAPDHEQRTTMSSAEAASDVNSALSPFLPASPQTARYLQHASSIPSHISSHFTPLELSHAIRVILCAFDEDVGSGDLTTLATIPAASSSSARFLAKESGTISGVHVADLVFHLLDPQLSTTWTVADGASVKAGTVVGVVTGSSRSLLTSERLALNLLQRMSGIATHTAALRRLIEAVGSPTLLLDTRKTAAGTRMLDKMAVRAGGAVNHRIGLYDMVMIKDNHITAAGGIRQAVEQCKLWCVQQQRSVPIEVETRTLDEVRQLIAYLHTEDRTTAPPVTRVMLDNMVRVARDETSGAVTAVDVSLLREAVQLLRSDELGRQLESEASGNVTADTIARIAETHVTFISVGAVTHSVRALDISLKIQ